MESGRGNFNSYGYIQGISPGTALPGGQRMQTCRRNSFNNVKLNPSGIAAQDLQKTVN